jgi:hypothetical protein
LARLAGAAAAAYGAVESRQWRERAAALEETLSALPQESTRLSGTSPR